MTSMLVMSVRHAYSVRGDARAAQQLADVLTKAPFDALRRVGVSVAGREQQHQPATAVSLRDALMHETADDVVLDSGRRGGLQSAARIGLGLSYKADADIPAPLASFVVVPHNDADQRVVEPVCALAEGLQVVFGFVTLESSFAAAHTAALGGTFTREPDAHMRNLSLARLGYRRAPWVFPREIGTKIAGPDWGTFLGPEHVRQLSLANLRAAGTFAVIRPLRHGGLYLQLTEDPADAGSSSIEVRVREARAALTPILFEDAQPEPEHSSRT